MLKGSRLIKFFSEAPMLSGIISLLLIALVVLPIYPQQDILKFKKLTSNDGLSQNFVSAIYQDKNGFMWFGTKDGLNRYDGYEFKVYRHNPFDTTSLSGNFISAIFEDSEGRLWVASTELDLFVPEKDVFKRIVLKIPTTKTDSAININRITSITEDKNGLIWLGTNDGLISYDPHTELSRRYYQKQEANAPLSDNLILSLSSDDSLLIIGTQNGMKLLSLDTVKKNKIEYVNIIHEEATEVLTSKRTILSQFRASSNIIYSGTPAGLIRIDISTRK